jgi:hypothetical protein
MLLGSASKASGMYGGKRLITRYFLILIKSKNIT